MKIFWGLQNVKHFRSPVIAIGVFDGVHRGHQVLIQKTIEEARRIKGTSVVMTFDPHPVNVLHPENRLPLIMALSLRLKLFADLGVDQTVVVKFTKRFAAMSPQAFIQRYLVNSFRPKGIIVGDDFRFGQNRSGTVEVFAQAGAKSGFWVKHVNTQAQGRKQFSSTQVRDAIAQGDLKKAAFILGRPVTMMGCVQRGDGRGQKLGFPTANLIPRGEILPPRGVYSVRVRVKQQWFQGIVNIGVRPTFKHHEEVLVEAHLFHFHRRIYGQPIIVEFLHKIRDEHFFPSKEALIEQIQNDQACAQAWFSRRVV